MLVKCPECQSDVSDKASSCPKCGFLLKQEMPSEVEKEQNTNSQIYRFLKLGFTVIFVLAFVSSMKTILLNSYRGRNRYYEPMVSEQMLNQAKTNLIIKGAEISKLSIYETNVQKVLEMSRVQSEAIASLGSVKATIPLGYKISDKEKNYVQISDRNGLPCIFITMDVLEEEQVKAVKSLDSEESMSDIFLVTQKKIERKKTSLMDKCGIKSDVIKWGEPYKLKKIKASVWAVDFIRRDKSICEELLVFCTNIQIVKGSEYYQINLKRVEPSSVSIEPPPSRLILDFMDSIVVSE